MIVGTFVYFAIAITLCALGFLAIFSIGAPFFLTGIAMLVASVVAGVLSSALRADLVLLGKAACAHPARGL